jgi:hypothetical protein
MVGLPGHGGLPTGRALHPRFDPHHRWTAEQFFTAEVRIRRYSAAGVWDDDAGRMVYPPPEVVWQGWARLQRVTRMELTRNIGDRQVVVRGVVVSMPVETPMARIGDEIVVLGYRDPHSGDPHLPGQPLWVYDVRPGSLLWQRDLIALEAPPTSRGE